MTLIVWSLLEPWTPLESLTGVKAKKVLKNNTNYGLRMNNSLEDNKLSSKMHSDSFKPL